MRRWMPLIGGLVIGLGVGIIVIFGFLIPADAPHSGDPLAETGSTPIPSMDAPAPEFELSSLAGDRVHLEDYRGRVVLLNFWATWCAPCRLEMPAFQSRAERYPDDLAIVAVNNAENPAEVQAFIDELSLNFDVLLDPEAEIQRLYQVRGYPTTFLIDPDGVIRVQKIGLLTEGELDEFLQDLGVGR